MPELDFDNKTKEELEAIAAEEGAQAEAAQKEADEAAARAAKEAEEAAAAKAAAEAALAKKAAEVAGAPVNAGGANEVRKHESWKRHCVRMGYNRNKPMPADWS